MSVLHDPELEELLEQLHARTDAQREAMRTHAASETDPSRIKAFMTLPFDGGLELSVRC